MSKQVPSAVKKAQEQAEAAHKAMYGLPQDTEQKDEAKAEDQKPAPDEQPASNEQPESDSTPQAQNEPKPDQGDEWKRKYESLRGKYDAEIPRLAADLRALRSEKQEMERQLKELQEAKQAPESTGDTEGFDEAVRKLTDEYGEEFYDLLRKVARKEAGGQEDLKSMRKELEFLKQDRQLSKRERFDKDLLDAVPDWERVNVDPQWHAWLAETDPFTGEVRQTLLDRAAAALDAKRVAAIFTAFKGPTRPQQNEPSPKNERSVSPPRSRSSEPPPTQPQYTVADWERLQEEVRRGKWKHRMNEFHEREEAIHKALTGS